MSSRRHGVAAQDGFHIGRQVIEALPREHGGQSASSPMAFNRAAVVTVSSTDRPVHSWRYTSRAVNGLASRPRASRVASRAAATRAASVTAA